MLKITCSSALSVPVTATVRATFQFRGGRDAHFARLDGRGRTLLR